MPFPNKSLSLDGVWQLRWNDEEHRVRSHWDWVQATYPECRHYRWQWLGPAIGVRVGGESEHDLRAGSSGRQHPDIIAIADYAMDTHGAGNRHGGCGERAEPPTPPELQAHFEQE